jgi:hypothetical protein
MLFTVEKDGAEVSCSSPRCVRLLLELGWQLASPSQKEHLLEALEAEQMLLPREDHGI